MNPTKVYLAGQYSRRRELAGYAQDLRGIGVEVTSTWLQKGERDAVDDGHVITAEKDDQILWANENLLDVLACDVLVAFSEPEGTLSRGNRHIEFGMALGAGKQLVVVGPREMVFHHLEGVYQYDTWNEALEALNRLIHAVVL